METSDYEPGTIYEQSREKGSTVTEGATLKIYIASEVAVDEPIEEESVEETE